jgi:hypothetical protein
MKFSYSKKQPEKSNTDSRIKKLLKTLSRPPKVVEVHDLRNDKGNKYVGTADYKNKKIILDKNESNRTKYTTVAHEVAHFKLREKGINSGNFSKGVQEQLKKTKMYQNLKKQGYERKKIPEEAFAIYYTQLKTGNQAKLKEFEKKYPIIAKRFSQLAKK